MSKNTTKSKNNNKSLNKSTKNEKSTKYVYSCSVCSSSVYQSRKKKATKSQLEIFIEKDNVLMEHETTTTTTTITTAEEPEIYHTKKTKHKTETENSIMIDKHTIKQENNDKDINIENGTNILEMSDVMCSKCKNKKRYEYRRNPAISVQKSGIVKESTMKLMKNKSDIRGETIRTCWISEFCMNGRCTRKSERYGYCRKCFTDMKCKKEADKKCV